MKTVLQRLATICLTLVLASCANIGVGGSVSGGSSGDVNVGVGVGIHL